MAKTLVIVESPAKAKSLTKFLGRKYQVLASMGHVRDLPRSQFGVNVDKGFTPKYITIRGKGETISELRTAVKKADKVLLASDPDREGEAIAWHLQQLLKLDENDAIRVEFNEITPQAVVDAVKHPRPINGNLVNAQQARRILDRLVGYNLSPLLWRKVRRGLSAGRVQSVALYLICDREDEIDAFVPEEYWTLGVILTKGKDKFEAKLFSHKGNKVAIGTKEEMDVVLEALSGNTYTVSEVRRKERLKKPAPPFTTSTLQQEANRKLNFTTRRTMMAAQQLYEGLDLGKEGHTGLVTYIRTDSVRVSRDAQDEAARFIAQRFGEEYLPKARPFYGTKGKGKVQDAHEAIRPTSVGRRPEQVKNYLTSDQYKLYELIWSRFVASQMAAAVLDATRVNITAGSYVFKATGAVMKFAGYTQVYSAESPDEDEGRLLPELNEGDQLKVVRRQPKQHFTQPPPRYTEASLVKTLEEKGIGRPSTYAPIVETLVQKRGYVLRRGKNLVPTDLGKKVLEMLKEYFPDVINVEFTAGMEEKLDDVEEGEVDWVTILDDFYRSFRQDVAKAEEEIGKISVEEEEEVTDELCEHCGRNMVIKTGRYGRFLACPGFPQCRNARPILEDTGQLCPKCGEKVVVRRTRKGRTFYGCAGYPKCDFVTWDKPVNEKCPDCGAFLVEKKTKKGRTYYCANPDCAYKDKQVSGAGKP